VNGWGLLLSAVLVGAEAVRVHRRELRVRRPRRQRSTLAGMAAIGLRFRGRLAARLARPPDPAMVRRSGLATSPAEAGAARLGFGAVFGAVGVAAGVVVGGVAGVVVALGTLGLGWAYPELRVRSAARRRSAVIERAAPALLELVAAGVEAGVPIEAALKGAAGATRDELAEELERSRMAVVLGRPRGEEFRDLGERTGAPTLASLGLALRLSDRLGVPLADALRAQAVRSRAEAARAVQERAARAGPRILAVVVFVLVPAALLPIAAAVALTIAGSLANPP
jgi:Flp pilus assembly protein TadB